MKTAVRRSVAPKAGFAPAAKAVRAAAPKAVQAKRPIACSSRARFNGKHEVASRPAPVALRALADSPADSDLRAGLEVPTVLVAEKLGEAGIELLKQHANVECCYDMSEADLLEKIAESDAIIVRSGTQVTKEVFTASKGRLRVVGRAGVGIDNVDVHAATETGCVVVNAPTANTVAAAEHGIAMLCAFSRNVPQADASMRAGKWERSKYVGVSLVDKTIAVMGFGKVGSEVARRAQGLGMKVIASDPYAPQDKAKAMGVELVSFDEAVARADFFSLHMPLTPTTDKMFNADVFKRMKKNAVIINVARGGVIDDQALADALDNEEIAGAALDVFTKEPPTKEENPLIGRPNVVLTPHLGASTVEAQEGVAVEVAEAVLTALRGDPAPSAINAPMVTPELMKELMPSADLVHKLALVATQLVAQNEQQVQIHYRSCTPDDLDTRLLRANVVKGLVEHTTQATINLVNYDLIAEQRGLKISEMKERHGEKLVGKTTISLPAAAATFPAACDADHFITVGGKVNSQGRPILTTLGQYAVDVSLEGSLVLFRQKDQPGVIGAVGTKLAEHGINVNYMNVGRQEQGQDAVMAIGVDQDLTNDVVASLKEIPALIDVIAINLPRL